MGFRISYIAADMPALDLATAFHMGSAGETTEMPDGEDWAARLTSGHSILWSEDELFGLNRLDAILDLSRHRQVLYVVVNETVMASTVFCYHQGAEVWQVHWQGDEGVKPENLSISGAAPALVEAVKSRVSAQYANEDPDFDYFFEIPLEIAKEICGFRHDMYLENHAVDTFLLLQNTAPPKRPGLFSRWFGGKS